MAIKQQIESDKPHTGRVRWCIAKDDCLVRHVDFDQIQNVCMPYKPPKKLTLFYASGVYVDKDRNEYTQYKSTADPTLCSMCGKNTNPARYCKEHDYYCEDCVTVVS